MRRAVLIHWRPEEGAARLGALTAAGWQGECYTPQGGNLKPLRESPPEAFVIDLSRLPSQGWGVGILLRRSSQTRRVPIVFAGGDPAKVERIKKELPDAVYCQWERIADALAEAIRNAPDQPVVPEPMAGYSGTPLAKKLGIKERTALTLLNAPQGFLQKLSLPGNVKVHQHPAEAHRVMLFVRDAAELKRGFPKAAAIVAKGGGLWIAWPKKASGLAKDLSQKDVRALGMSQGWVDYKVCAVDETWSGFLFAPQKKPASKSR
jgi:hypothetical protein